MTSFGSPSCEDWQRDEARGLSRKGRRSPSSPHHSCVAWSMPAPTKMIKSNEAATEMDNEYNNNNNNTNRYWHWYAICRDYRGISKPRRRSLALRRVIQLKQRRVFALNWQRNLSLSLLLLLSLIRPELTEVPPYASPFLTPIYESIKIPH